MNNINNINNMSSIEFLNGELSTLEKAKSRLLPIPGVLGVGLTHSNVTNVSTPGYQILVSIENISVISSLPTNIDGISVIYKISKRVKSASLNLSQQEINSSTIQSLQFTSRYRPIQGGTSIGLLNVPNSATGTLGCFVKDSQGNIVILSNNHVISYNIGNSTYKGKVGDPIIQPGRVDGGTISDQIGTLEKWTDITSSSNLIDAAYAIPTSVSIEPNICNLYTGNSTIPKIGMECKKAGRSTGCVDGVVESLNAAYYVDYDIFSGTSTTTFSALFDDLLTLANPNNYPITQAGDSGSMWVSSCGNNAVGLTFAGDSTGASIACKATNIESILGVKFGLITSASCRNPCILTYVR